MGTVRKNGNVFPKRYKEIRQWVKKFLNGYRGKTGTSLQKGIKKFVNGYRAKNGNVFPKRYKEISQWVQGEKWEHLSQKVLRNSSMGTGRKMGTSFPKGIKKFLNGYRAKNGNIFLKRY